jgi:hypothetical protein
MVTAAARSRNTDNLRFRFQEGRIFYSQDVKFPPSASPSLDASLTFPLFFQIQMNSAALRKRYHEDSMSLCSYCTLDTPMIHAAIIRLQMRPKFQSQSPKSTAGPKSEIQGPPGFLRGNIRIPRIAFLSSLLSPLSSLLSRFSQEHTEEDRGQRTETQRDTERLRETHRDTTSYRQL